MRYFVPIVSILFLGIFSLAAAENEPELIVKIKDIFVSPAELEAGDITQLTVIIENSKIVDVKLDKIELVSPWQYSKDLDNIIKPGSSQAVTIDVLIPEDTKAQKFNLVASITDSEENVMSTSKELTVKKAESLKIEYTAVLALLLAYYIPAQFIERFLEATNLGKRFRTLSTEDQASFGSNFKAKIASYTKLRENLITDLTLPLLMDEHQMKAYHTQIDKLDTQIAKTSTKLIKENTKYAFKIWLHSLWMSILPAAAFAYYGLGILQVIGNGGSDTIILDSIINILFIGSGTKPIHDITERILKIKK